MRRRLQDAIEARATQFLQCPVQLVSAEPVTESFTLVRLAGEGLRTYRDQRPADAFKLHLPAEPGVPVPPPQYDDRGRLVWPSGSPPWTRCFTVSEADARAGTLAFNLFHHAGGRSSQWLAHAAPGDVLQLTGFRTEYAAPLGDGPLLLVADSSALPALIEVLRSRRDDQPTIALAAVGAGDRALVPETHRHRVQFVPDPQLLPSAVEARAEADKPTHAWVCGEHEMVRRIRRQLLDGKTVHPDELHAAGYWHRGEDWERTFKRSLDRFTAAAQAGKDVTDPQLLQRLAFDPVSEQLAPSSIEKET